MGKFDEPADIANRLAQLQQEEKQATAKRDLAKFNRLQTKIGELMHRRKNLLGQGLDHPRRR